MYPEKVLQGIPEFNGASNFARLDFLVVPKVNIKPLSKHLLSESSGFACCFQVLSAHPSTPLQSGFGYGILNMSSWCNPP